MGRNEPGPTARRCVFCDIVRGDAAASVVFEDGASLAFLDHRPLLPGHCLLVPKAHHETLTDLPAAAVGPLFANAQLLARAVEARMEANGVFLAINNRISQSVPHLHVHIVPRWTKDGLFSRSYVWKRQPYENDEALRQAQESIRSAVNRLKPAPVSG